MLYITMKSGREYTWHVGYRFPITIDEVDNVSSIQMDSDEYDPDFVPPFLAEKRVVKLDGGLAKAYCAKYAKPRLIILEWDKIAEIVRNHLINEGHDPKTVTLEYGNGDFQPKRHRIKVEVK